EAQAVTPLKRFKSPPGAMKGRQADRLVVSFGQPAVWMSDLHFLRGHIWEFHGFIKGGQDLIICLTTTFARFINLVSNPINRRNSTTRGTLLPASVRSCARVFSIWESVAISNAINSWHLGLGLVIRRAHSRMLWRPRAIARPALTSLPMPAESAFAASSTPTPRRRASSYARISR